jgi:hypothetical protein
MSDDPPHGDGTDGDGTDPRPSDAPPTGPPDAGDDTVGAVLFTYGAPFVGVLLVAVGIGAAVPGAYGLVQTDIADCGDPIVSVEPVEEQFDGGPPESLPRLTPDDLTTGERKAFQEALADPRSEAAFRDDFRNRPAFENGTLVETADRTYYATIVADHPCFTTAPLQFPLGVFAIALGIVGILTPPGYRRLVALEERIRD